MYSRLGQMTINVSYRVQLIHKKTKVTTIETESWVVVKGLHDGIRDLTREVKGKTTVKGGVRSEMSC